MSSVCHKELLASYRSLGARRVRVVLTELVNRIIGVSEPTTRISHL